MKFPLQFYRLSGVFDCYFQRQQKRTVIAAEGVSVFLNVKMPRQRAENPAFFNIFRLGEVNFERISPLVGNNICRCRIQIDGGLKLFQTADGGFGAQYPGLQLAALRPVAHSFVAAERVFINAVIERKLFEFQQ